MLQDIKTGDKPKQIIHRLSEDLLAAFTGKKLLDNYDIYQHLMTYWNDIAMQDDVYILVTDGWKAGNEIETDKKKKEWEGRLVPKQIITAKYFPKEQKQLDELQATRDNIARQLEELEEEDQLAFPRDRGLVIPFGEKTSARGVQRPRSGWVLRGDFCLTRRVSANHGQRSFHDLEITSLAAFWRDFHFPL